MNTKGIKEEANIIRQYLCYNDDFRIKELKEINKARSVLETFLHLNNGIFLVSSILVPLYY